MNRFITNCGRAVFRAKLVDLKDKFGIAATEVAAPYTSQECSSCHYVDKTNRPSQTKSACRWCDNASHAGVDASRVVNQRCALGLGTKWLTRGAILAVLVNQRIKKWPLIRSNGLHGATHDPRRSNPYVKSWADLARNALETQGGGALCLKAIPYRGSSGPRGTLWCGVSDAAPARYVASVPRGQRGQGAIPSACLLVVLGVRSWHLPSSSRLVTCSVGASALLRQRPL
jgi:hypothetical protein